MIHILLLILKIIGIVIAVIIGLVVLALCTVLFVPIRYRMKGSRYDSLEGTAKVYWLFHAISIKVTYPWGEDGSVHIVARILGKRIYDNLRNENQSSEHNKDKRQEKAPKAARMSTPRASQEKTQTPGKVLKMPEVVPAAEKSAEGTQKSSPVERIKGKLFAIKNMLQGKIQRIKNKMASMGKKKDRFLKKLAGIRKKKDGVMAILFDPKNRSAFRTLKKELFRILRHIKPVKLSGKLYFGFEDPASTGYALGALSLLYPVYEDHVALYPDFEEKKAQGELYMAGRIQLAVFVRAALRLVLNKDIRRVIQSFKHI